MADVETKFLNERVVVEIRFANEIVDFPFSIRSRPSSGLDHGGSLKIKIKVNSKSDFHFYFYFNLRLFFIIKFVLLNQDHTFFYQLDQNMKTKIVAQIYPGLHKICELFKSLLFISKLFIQN